MVVTTVCRVEYCVQIVAITSRIQNLSLRYCAITSKGAHGIGLALGTAKFSNTKLLSLNLSGNLIDDDGAEHIARVSVCVCVCVCVCVYVCVCVFVCCLTTSLVTSSVMTVLSI